MVRSICGLEPRKQANFTVHKSAAYTGNSLIYSAISDRQRVFCWLGLFTCKNHPRYNLYCVGGDIRHCSIQSNPDSGFVQQEMAWNITKESTHRVLICTTLTVVKKLEWWGSPTVKTFNNMTKLFWHNTITDGQTDRQMQLKYQYHVLHQWMDKDVW